MPNSQLDEKAVFNIARGIESSEERAEYLEQFRDRDPALFERVSALLDGLNKQESFLEVPANGIPSTVDSAVIERVGSTIGPYKLREQLAEGGMGVVYVAEQLEPVRRRVALKIIKPGMDTKEVVARFEAERQALALMNHPNIARVFDGGATDSGRPYFVMELVRGVPITEFCDQQRLSTSQRLELFLDVCRAVQHAHQKGIIHRDLKPSNVLVSEIDGSLVPKVIDFGVAKAVNQKLVEQTVYTQFSQMIGTPLYMSPEQAGTGVVDVDTRSDVYSLGVLLYELLTGSTPFNRETMKQAGYEEVRRIIREEEPNRPSAQISTLQAQSRSTVAERRNSDPRKLRDSLRGELDWIVMKTLEKDRNRRYESASALVADIQRYLDNEPVEACPPSAMYRFQKILRRNRILLTTTTLVAASLLVGTAVSMWQAIDAQQARSLADQSLDDERQARQEADANFQLARETVDTFLTKVSEDLLLDQPGLQPLRKDLLELALSYYERFAREHADDPRVRDQLAEALTHVGEINQAIDSQPAAFEAFQEAVSIRQQIAGEAPNNLSRQLELVEAYRNLTLQSSRMGKSSERTAATQRMLDILERMQQRFPDSHDLLLAKVRTYREGTPRQSLVLAQQALEMIKTLPEDHPQYYSELAQCEAAVAARYSSLADRAFTDAAKISAYRQAIPHVTRAIEIQERRLRKNPSLMDRFDLSKTYIGADASWGNLAEKLLEDEASRQEGLDALDMSEKCLSQSVQLLEELVHENPMVYDFANLLAMTHYNAAVGSLNHAERSNDAALVEKSLAEMIRATELNRRLASQFPELPNSIVGLHQTATGCVYIADISRKIPSVTEEQHHRICEQALHAAWGIPEKKRKVAGWASIGRALYFLDRYDESIAAFERGFELRGENSPTTDLGDRWWYMTMALARSGQTERAREYFEILDLEARMLQQKDELENRDEAAEVLGIEVPTKSTATKLSDLVNKAKAVGVENWRAYFALGRRLRIKKQPEQAIRAFLAAADLLKEIPQEDRSPSDWGHLGQALYRSKQYAQARDVFEKAIGGRIETKPTIELGPRWWYMAMLLARSGETELASEYYERLVGELETRPAAARIVHQPYERELAQLLGIDEETSNESEKLPIESENNP